MKPPVVRCRQNCSRQGSLNTEKRLTDLDLQIIEMVRSGNSRAFSVLVDRHKDQAMTLAVRLVGERGEAEELVQDAFVNAYRNLEQFRGDAKFSTWFYRILYNLCMTRVTRRKAKPESLDDGEENLLRTLVNEDEISIQERMEQQEIHRLVSSEVGNLPEKLRTAILLFYVQEMSYEEVSAVMNVPLGSVKTYLHRGRHLLRQRLLVRLKEEVTAV